MDARFDDWMRRQAYAPRTISSRLSDMRRIEAVYGDIDALIADGTVQSVLDSLVYDADAKARRAPNPSKIAIGGDLYDGLASLRSALQLYRRYAVTRKGAG